MAPVSISKPEHRIEDGWYVASASVDIEGKTYQLKYKASEGPVAKNSDPFVAATLLPAMKVGQSLQVAGTVSPKVFAATQTIQDIFHRWFPEFRKISIEDSTGPLDEVSQSTEVGAFFSGGVDSFYTMLKHRDEITKIILIHGFNQYYSPVLRANVTNVIRRAAKELGKPLIEVETNVRELSDQYTDYTDHYVGAMLVSVGLLLAPQFKKIYIPGTFSYEHLHPVGTHPLLDPLWSTEGMTFVHDGCEANRAEKIARIARSETALRSLRVCFENRDDSAYNCGRCEKCIRTMLGLQAVGALERCTTFNQKLNTVAVSRMKMNHPANIYFAEDNLRALENSGQDPALIEALRICIKSNKFDQLSSHLNENLSEFLTSDHGTRFVRGKKNIIFKSLRGVDSRWLLREVLKEEIKNFDRKFLFGMLQRLYGRANANSQ